MAKPIKPTPILTGKDASNFYENMQKNKTSSSDPKERERLLSAIKSVSPGLEF
jgi:hypothetical protein